MNNKLTDNEKLYVKISLKEYIIYLFINSLKKWKYIQYYVYLNNLFIISLKEKLKYKNTKILKEIIR